MDVVKAKNWYQDTKQYIEQMFGEGADLFTALLAATSPQVHVKTSWDMAGRIYHEFNSGIRPSMIGCMGCHRANVLRALSGQPLQGNKVRAFYANLRGDLNQVTIDGWMLKLFKWFERGTKRIPTNNQYRKLERTFQKIARNNGYEPAEFQSILWTWYRERNGYKHVSYVSVGQDLRQYTFADLF